MWWFHLLVALPVPTLAYILDETSRMMYQDKKWNHWEQSFPYIVWVWLDPTMLAPPNASLALLVYLRPEFTNGSVQKMDSAWGRQVGHQRATSHVLSFTTASGSLSHKLPPPGHEIPAQRRRRNRSNRPHMQQIRLDPFLSAGIHWPQTETAVGIFQISHAPRSWAADLLHARSFTKRLEIIS